MSITLKARHLVAGAIAVVVLAAGSGALAGSGTFTDVGESHPFFDEIEAMGGAGISTGFPDGTFRPGEPVTRQAMAAFMGRGFGRVASAEGAGTVDDPLPEVAELGDVTIAAGATQGGNGYVLVTGWATFQVVAETTCPCAVNLQITDGDSTIEGAGTMLSNDDVEPTSGAALGGAAVSGVFEIPADEIGTFTLLMGTLDADAVVNGQGNVSALYVPFDGTAGETL